MAKKSFKCRLLLTAALMPLVLPGLAIAQDGVAYVYDELGRLVESTNSGSPNGGAQSTIAYDKAGNRTNYTVSNVPTPTPPPTPSPTPTPTPTPPPGNQPPVAISDNFTMVCNSGGGFNVLANDYDPDGNPLTLVSATSNGTISVSVGSATQGIVSIGVGPRGSFTASYVVSDGQGGTATGSIYVTVTAGGPYC